MYSLGLLIRLIAQLPIRRDSKMNSFSWRRGLLTVFLLAVLLPIQIGNALALWLDRFLFRFEKIEPRSPVFVVGVPRSGTTLVHRLMALDQPEWTTFRLWELIFAPSICQKKILLALATIDRWLGRPVIRTIGWIERRVLGGLDAIHGTSLFDPEEDYLSLIPYAGCFLLVHCFPFSDEIWKLVQPTREEPTTDHRSTLIRHYRGMVQRHLYVYGPDKIFLSKNPSFTALIPLLYERFPDARVIGCYRDPGRAIPSLLSSMESGARLVGNSNNAAFQESLAQMAQDFYKCLARAHERYELFRTLDFSQLTKDPARCVKRICEELGLNSFAPHEIFEKACLTATNYKSKHAYDVNQFGLDIDKIKLELECCLKTLSRPHLR